MSSCHHVIMASWHHVNMASCQHVNMSTCQHVIMSSWILVNLSSYHVIISSWILVNLWTCQHVIMSPWILVKLSPYHVILNSCQLVVMSTCHPEFLSTPSSTSMGTSNIQTGDLDFQNRDPMFLKQTGRVPLKMDLGTLDFLGPYFQRLRYHPNLKFTRRMSIQSAYIQQWEKCLLTSSVLHFCQI